MVLVVGQSSPVGGSAHHEETTIDAATGACRLGEHVIGWAFGDHRAGVDASVIGGPAPAADVAQLLPRGAVITPRQLTKPGLPGVNGDQLGSNVDASRAAQPSASPAA